MNGWMDGDMDTCEWVRWMDGRTDRQMDGQMDEWGHGYRDGGWMRWTDGQVGRWLQST